MNIDEESEKFIKWVEEKLEDEDYMDELIAEIDQRMADFYINLNPKVLLEKMRLGALEHGAPPTIDQVSKEIEMEMLDLVGWGLMERWKNAKDR